jgi:hypothetical protein
MREEETPQEEPEEIGTEIGTEIDPIDPLKRDREEGDDMPGLDPVVSPVPPE